MAHMIPDAPPPPGPGRIAEGRLYEALRDGLGEDCFVYHGLHYFEEERARQGEADFLVLHRERGMLVIECKGSGVRRTGKGEWLRILEDGREAPLKKDPFAQAQGHIHDLVRKIEPETLKLFPHLTRFPFVYGHAVAFPMVAVGREYLPLNAPRSILFDADDLGRMDERVEEVFTLYGKQAPGDLVPLTDKEFKRFRKRILYPVFSLVPSLGARIKGEEAALVRLGRQQASIVGCFLDNRRLRIKGAAGSGKTMLALEACRRLADQGEKVLLLCFNRNLANWLEEAVKAGGNEGGIQVKTFHRLCRWAYHKLEYEFAVPEEEAARSFFWDEEAPLVLLEALERGVIEPWDSIVVDEGQDFSAGWWEAIEELLKEKAKGRLFIFYDPTQNIFGRSDSIPEHPTFTLTHNYRNTKAITGKLRRLGRPDMTPHESCPDGVEPSVHQMESPARTARRLDELVARLIEKEGLLPTQIALLSPHSRPHSCLAEVASLGGAPISVDPAKREGALLHSTIGAFKGLESDVVILVDIDPDDPYCSRNARYVAASRAKHLLHVFTKGDWMAG